MLVSKICTTFQNAFQYIISSDSHTVPVEPLGSLPQVSATAPPNLKITPGAKLPHWISGELPTGILGLYWYVRTDRDNNAGVLASGSVLSIPDPKFL